MRRASPAWVILLLVMLLAGCSSHETSSQDQTPSPTASSNTAGILDDFPLAQGLVADGDTTTVSTPRRDVPGVDLAPRCWDRAWPGAAVLAVEDSSEWTRASAVSGARDLQRTDRDVVAHLCLFRDAGC